MLALSPKRLVKALSPTLTVLVLLLLGPTSAHATVTHPEFYNNFVRVADGTSFTEPPPNGGSLLDTHGEFLFTSPALGPTEIECVFLSFENAWNAQEEKQREFPRGHGLVEGWWESGHKPGARTTTPLVSSKCYYAKGTLAGVEAWVSAEMISEEPPEKNPLKKNLSTPWRFEALCGEREEEQTVILKIGIPLTDPEYPDKCETEAQEEKEIKEEIEGITIAGRTPCYNKELETVGHTEPPGCVKVDIVVPMLGIESHFEGTLRVRVENGFGSGLNPSKWLFEGAARSGELHLLGSAPGFAGTLGEATTGVGKMIGFEFSELIQLH